MSMVVTTLGHLGADQLGMILPHEHVFVDLRTSDKPGYAEAYAADVVKLMAKLMFLPVADQIQSGTYLLYDGACGTGGMLTVAEETLRELAEEHGKEVSTLTEATFSPERSKLRGAARLW